MTGHIPTIKELMDLWEEFKKLELPEEEWEEYYQKRLGDNFK